MVWLQLPISNPKRPHIFIDVRPGCPTAGALSDHKSDIELAKAGQRLGNPVGSVQSWLYCHCVHSTGLRFFLLGRDVSSYPLLDRWLSAMAMQPTSNRPLFIRGGSS